MTNQRVLEILAETLGVSAEALKESIGSDWSESSTAVPNLIIRGFFPEWSYSDGSEEEDDVDVTYPDVGIYVDELNRQIQVGTLIGRYGPGWLGFDIKPKTKIEIWDREALQKLQKAIEESAKLALRKMKTCKFCNKTLPPAFMSEEGHCYDCGTSHLGTVY